MNRKFLPTARFALPSIILLVFLTLNMLLYTGGHATEFLGTSYKFVQKLQVPDRKRFSFLLNFVSDLGRVRTYAGDSNIFSALLFCATLSATGSSLLIFISKLDGEKARPKLLEGTSKSHLLYGHPELRPSHYRGFSHVRDAKATVFRDAFVRNYGILKALCRFSAVCFIAVGWAPQDVHHIFLILHLVFVNAAFGSIMAICVVVVSIYRRQSPKPLSRIYPVFCLTLLAILSAYLAVIVTWFFTRSMPAYFMLVIGQKIIVYLTGVSLLVFEAVLMRTP